MQPNAQSKCSRILSLVPWAQWTLIFLFNCGTSLHHRFKTPLISYDHRGSTLTYQHLRYDWNHFPLAPLGTKAIIYKDADTRASWAPHGVDAWMLGPSKDHYQCHFYMCLKRQGIESQAPWTSSPNIAWNQHSHLLQCEGIIRGIVTNVSRNTLQNLILATLKRLKEHVNVYIAGSLPPQPLQLLEQRVQQRVIDVAPKSLPPILQRGSTPPVTALANNPIAPRKLQTTKRTHERNMQANTLGLLPQITRINIIEPTPTVQATRQSATK
jgi:hypothetical protein